MGTLITTAEAAERLDTTPRTIRRWVAAGRLAGELIGDRLLVEVPFRPGTPRARPARPAVPSVTTTEAARRLGTVRATIHRWVQEGRLRGEQTGRQLWITEASVAAMERQQRNRRPGHVRDWR